MRTAYAASWRSLTDTHAAEAVRFVVEFAFRVSALRGLGLYLDVAAVPEPMRESVWTQALTSLDLPALQPPIELRRVRGWRRLRLDLVLDNLRDHRRYEARTLQLSRLAGARAAEAVVETHARNVLDIGRVLRGTLPVDQTTELYLHEFMLPQAVAQMVSQRVQAAVAADLLREEQAAPVTTLWATEQPASPLAAIAEAR
ncbi:MAG: hypothetical protein H0W67_07070 [Gemmatimonadales bacterium]|nr:hypothetical protein [Gemmatimonadales bacterium]